MKYKKHKDFVSSVRALYQKGGKFQKASDQVQAVVGKISSSDPKPFAGLNLTNHGENRIDKCLKYDLTGFSRLITIQDNNIVLLCFTGDHESCDKWLDRNMRADFNSGC